MGSIAENQKVLIENGFLESGAGTYQKLDLKGIDSVLAKYAEEFKDNLIVSINSKRINASGEMEKNITFDIIDEEGVKVMNIYVVDYAKFVDKGVRGWGSSKNAPTSPYSYGNPAKKSSNGQFRKSIKNYILSGKAKVAATDVKTYGAVKYEKKNKSLIDQQTEQLMYLIRRYGIKTTNFLSGTIDKTFGTLAQDIAIEIGREISINITK